MFYDKSLMNSEMLGNAWKLANNMSAENVEQSNLPSICTELDSWVNSDADQPRRRLSLRASSNLIGGAAKLYKCGIQKLFDDINKLDLDIRRRKRGHSSSPSTSENCSIESVETPEQMRRQTDAGFGTSISPVKRNKTESLSLKKTSYNITMSRSSTDESLAERRFSSNKEDSSQQCSNSNCEKSLENMGQSSSKGSGQEHSSLAEKPEQKQRKDQGVQTSPILQKKRRFTTTIEDSFDRNLPFGYILIHDSYLSRIPSKIIFTSINNDVKSLM